MPVGVLGKGLTKHNLKMLDDGYAQENNLPTGRAKSVMSGATSIRSKNETAEQRRERKQLVKEYRRVSPFSHISEDWFWPIHVMPLLLLIGTTS